MASFEFDVNLFSSVTINAETEGEARAWVKAHLRGVSCDFGPGPKGETLTACGSVEGFDLIAINGSDV